MTAQDVELSQFFQDVRDECHLSDERLDHVKWLVDGGLLSLADVRSMLARHAAGSLIERHGTDSTQWPSLSTVETPPAAAAQMPKKHLPREVPSHRSWGAVPTISPTLQH